MIDANTIRINCMFFSSKCQHQCYMKKTRAGHSTSCIRECDVTSTSEPYSLTLGIQHYATIPLTPGNTEVKSAGVSMYDVQPTTS